MGEHGVSRGTVRHALEILRNEGLIQTFPGRGTFVSDRKYYGIPGMTAGPSHSR